jgi:hypothetical protein
MNTLASKKRIIKKNFKPSLMYHGPDERDLMTLAFYFKTNKQTIGRGFFTKELSIDFISYHLYKIAEQSIEFILKQDYIKSFLIELDLKESDLSQVLKRIAVQDIYKVVDDAKEKFKE